MYPLTLLLASCTPQVANAESVLTVHHDSRGGSSRALRMVSVLNLYIQNSQGQVRSVVVTQAAVHGSLRDQGDIGLPSATDLCLQHPSSTLWQQSDVQESVIW